MALTPLAYLYCAEADADALLSTDGVDLRLDDTNKGGKSGPEDAYLTTQGVNYATARVNLYCLQRYDAADLATSWQVNSWATVILARWLCTRRGNPVPKSIQELYDEALEELKAVQQGTLSLGDVGTRNPDWPAWSNVTVRPEFNFKKTRVERSISEQTPVSYPRKVDFPDQYTQEP